MDVQLYITKYLSILLIPFIFVFILFKLDKNKVEIPGNRLIKNNIVEFITLKSIVLVNLVLLILGLVIYSPNASNHLVLIPLLFLFGRKGIAK